MSKHADVKSRLRAVALSALAGIFLLTAAIPAAAGQVLPDERLPPGWNRLSALRGVLRPALPPAPADGDLVVGYPDPNQVLTITGTYQQHGRIIILNNGSLVLDSADFTLQGDIIIAQNGSMTVRKGTFTVVQTYAYQYQATLLGGGRMEFDSAEAGYNGQSWGVSLMDSSRLAVSGSKLRQGFTTVSLISAARAEYRDADFSSEFLAFDSCRLSLARCDTALIWLTFPQSSSASLSLPGTDTAIVHWSIGPGTPGVSGVLYQVTLDTVSSVMWGTFPLPGSQVTLTDSRVRASGLIIPGADSVHLAGLVDGLHHQDYLLPLADRQYRLINTYNQTWNLYPAASTRLVLESSIFGELLAMDSSTVDIRNSICDGSGGYVGGEAGSRLNLIQATVYTQLVSRDRSLVFAGYSNIHYQPVNATGASVMLLVFCNTEYDPVARDTSIMFVSDFTVPQDASVGSYVPITGTAQVLRGPQSPLQFGSYRMSYAPADSPQARHQIGSEHYLPVVGGLLETWDTNGLVPGGYLLTMTLKDDAGDSLEPAKDVFLDPAGVALEPGTAHSPCRPRWCPSPNPFRISARVHGREGDLFTVYDVSGRAVGRYRGSSIGSDLPAGVYFIGDGIGPARQKMLKVK